MRTRVLLLVLFCGLAAAVLLSAQTPASPALTGQITSAEEGPMEGVLVPAALQLPT
jgi:hypothetical protein